MTTYILKCYCCFKTRYKPHVNIAAQKGKSLKCCPNIRKFEKWHRLAVLQLVLDTIEYKTLPNEYLWLRSMNVKQRLREKNEFLKMQFNSIVIQLKPAVARLHKKEMQLCKLYLRFAFKPNRYDKTKKPHISLICFRNVAFQSARCVNMNAMEDKENEWK